MVDLHERCVRTIKGVEDLSMCNPGQDDPVSAAFPTRINVFTYVQKSSDF